MNAQEIFDTVAKHLFEQGVKSILEDGFCVYRGPNDCKCAVGCLIPDEDYNKDMEYKDIDSLIKCQADFPYTIPDYFEEHRFLLTMLQVVHDDNHRNNWASTPIMRNALADVATRKHLNSAILETLSFKDR